MIHEALQHQRQHWPRDVPVIGMGHSFGAIVTLLVADCAPAVFDRLLLLDPIFLPPLLSVLSRVFRRTGLAAQMPMVRRARQRRAHWPDRAAARASLHQRGVFRGWHEDAFDAYLQHALLQREDGLHLLTPPALEAAVFASYASGQSPVIRRLQQPCHMIRGDRTFPYVQAGVARASRLNHRVSAEVVPGGHCFMQQDPVAVAGRLLQHLHASGIV